MNCNSSTQLIKNSFVNIEGISICLTSGNALHFRPFSWLP